MRTGLALALAIATLQPSPSWAGLEAMPTRIEVEQLTCADLLALTPERQERALVYLTGVVDGRRGAKAFDAVRAGAAIDRLLAECRTAPGRRVLEGLTAGAQAPASGR